MKILHITNALSEGGVESLLCDILPPMVEMGQIVDLLVLDKNRLGLKKILEQKGINVFCSGWTWIYNPLNIFVLRKYLPKYDIVHIHLFPVQYFAVFAKWLLLEKKFVLITTEHNTYNHRRKYSIFKFLDRLIYRNYDDIISITQGTADNLKKWTGIDSRVIYNGINIQTFIEAKNHGISREILNIPQNAFLCIMVARFNEQKDQDTVIKSLKLLPTNCCLLFVGSGERMNICRELSKEIGVSERVYFVGYSQNPAAYISISDVGILSSHWEGFGISALEYMILGKPTIVSDVDGLREVVGEGALVFEPHCVEDLGSKINSLFSNKSLYDHMKSKAHSRALQFDIKETVCQYLSEYQHCL